MWYGSRIFILLLFATCVYSQKPPNIILILTDDQGWGDLSYHGNTNLHTPHIDQLAHEGIFFDRFYVSPVCSPTRAEILTGRYHVRSGVYATQDGGERMDLDETTLAEVLKQAGYKTAAFGKWHNGTQAPYHPNARGFDEFYGFTSGHWGNYFSPMLDHNGEIVKGEGFLPDDLTDHALRFIKNNRLKPFFLYLPYNTPHSPMQVPEQYWLRQKDKPLNKRNRNAIQEDTLFTKAALAMVENIDENVGRVTNRIKELGLEERTIFIFLSDNGPNGVRWNDGMKGKKGSTDEGGVRSPFIIKWKNHLDVGKIEKRIASGIDLLPTLVKLINIDHKPEKALDGKDLFSQEEDRIIYNFWHGRLSLRTQRFRLDHQDALFDMSVDPGQKIDVRFEFPEEHKYLMDKKEVWLRNVASELNTKEVRPFTVGDVHFRYTHLPIRDAKYSGEISLSNRWSNSAFLTNWTSESDSIYWQIEVLEKGKFAVELYHTCPTASVGSRLQISAPSSSVRQTLEVAHDPPLIGEEYDVVPRTESYVKDFRVVEFGNIDLQKGKQDLVLKAVDLKGDRGIDVRMLVLKRIGN